MIVIWLNLIDTEQPVDVGGILNIRMTKITEKVLFFLDDFVCCLSLQLQ